MGCMQGMKRVNSANYIGTCRYEGLPNNCDFVNIEDGKVVIWNNKVEDKVFTGADFEDFRPIAYIVLNQGLNLVFGAKVQGKRMAFQFEWCHLNSNEYLANQVLDLDDTFKSLKTRGNRSIRIQNFINTIGSPIKINEINWDALPKLIFKTGIKLEESFKMIMDHIGD